MTLLPVLSILDLAKYNLQSSFYQTKPEEDQYLANFSPNNQFASNVKSDNKNNNIIITIEELFLNIGYKLTYEKLIKKTIHETYIFFIFYKAYEF